MIASSAARARASPNTMRPSAGAIERAVRAPARPAPKRSTTARRPGEPGVTAVARQHVGIDDRHAERGEPRETVATSPSQSRRSARRATFRLLSVFGAARRRSLRVDCGSFGRGERVLQQHRDGQRPDAAGHRRERAGDLRGRRVHVADDRPSRASRTPPASASPRRRSARSSARSLTGVVPTSMTVAPGLTKSRVTNAGRPIAATRMSAARGDRRQVRGLRMADRDGGVALQQQHRHRLADDLAAADHDRVLPGDRRGRRGRASRSRPTACTASGGRAPCTSLPTLTGWNPSTSLSGSMASKTRCAACLPHRVRQRGLHEDAVVPVARDSADRRAAADRRATPWPEAAADRPTGRPRCPP